MTATVYQFPQLIPPPPPLSVYERVFRRIPILDAAGGMAEWVYDAVSTPVTGLCSACGLPSIIEGMHEWKLYAAEKRYRPVRDFDLCEVCREALSLTPIGEKWARRRRSKKVALADAIRRLEAVGHHDAVAALRALL